MAWRDLKKRIEAYGQASITQSIMIIFQVPCHQFCNHYTLMSFIAIGSTLTFALNFKNTEVSPILPEWPSTEPGSVHFSGGVHFTAKDERSQNIYIQLLFFLSYKSIIKATVPEAYPQHHGLSLFWLFLSLHRSLQTPNIDILVPLCRWCSQRIYLDRKSILQIGCFYELIKNNKNVNNENTDLSSVEYKWAFCRVPPNLRHPLLVQSKQKAWRLCLSEVNHMVFLWKWKN